MNLLIELLFKSILAVNLLDYVRWMEIQSS